MFHSPCHYPETPPDLESELQATAQIERDMESGGVLDRDREREGERDKQHDTEHSNEKEGDTDCGYPHLSEDQQRAHTGQDRRTLPSHLHQEGTGPGPVACPPSTNMTLHMRRESLDTSTRSSATTMTKKDDNRDRDRDRMEIRASSLKSLNSLYSMSSVGNSCLNTRGTQFSSPSLSPSPLISPNRDPNKTPDRKQYGYSLSSTSASASASACASVCKQSRHVQVSPASSVTQLEPDALHKPLDILIVDDSRLNRKMLCKVLRSKGHICDEAEDGVQAVKKVMEKMKSSPEQGNPYFDAILMDFVMPNMDGPTGGHIAKSRVQLEDAFICQTELRNASFV